MKGGPKTPTIKRYFNACETAGYKPSSVRLCYSGDVIMYFEIESSPSVSEANEWDIEIGKA